MTMSGVWPPESIANQAISDIPPTEPYTKAPTKLDLSQV